MVSHPWCSACLGGTSEGNRGALCHGTRLLATSLQMPACAQDGCRLALIAVLCFCADIHVSYGSMLCQTPTQ
jgi:hypothetical protein